MITSPVSIELAVAEDPLVAHQDPGCRPPTRATGSVWYV